MTIFQVAGTIVLWVLAKKLLNLLKESEPPSPSYRDDRKLFAHTWWIDDAKTHIGNKMNHPWVCRYDRHPDNSNEYLLWLRSTKKQRPETSVETPPNVLPGLDKKGYICLNACRGFSEDIINSGEHIGDMPDDIKKEIKEKLKSYRKKRMRRL